MINSLKNFKGENWQFTKNIIYMIASQNGRSKIADNVPLYKKFDIHIYIQHTFLSNLLRHFSHGKDWFRHELQYCHKPPAKKRQEGTLYSFRSKSEHADGRIRQAVSPPLHSYPLIEIECISLRALVSIGWQSSDVQSI